MTIGNKVRSIGTDAFSGCTSLNDVYISNLTAWCNIYFYNGSANPLSYAHNLYLNGTRITELVIPNDVTSIGNYAFRGCTGLTSITIPNSVASIGDYSFYNCTNLTSINIPNSVISIGSFAFQYCSGLISVTIPNSVTSIGTGSFSLCGLTSVTIPNSLTTINTQAFEKCHNLTSVTISNSVTSIYPYAFNGCTNLTSINIPNSVTSIYQRAFYDCSGLTSITIPNSVTSIGDYTFYGCSGLTSITIPNSVTSIGNYTFSGCSGLTSITIPNSVTSIGERAFSGCSGLTSVTIPNSVTSIGNYAFSCSGLTKVKAEKSTAVSITYNTFSNSKNATLYVPYGCKLSYGSSSNYWRLFKTIKEFPDTNVNGDSETNVVDVVDIARFVVGTPSSAFEEFLADLNSDRSVTVADAIVLVNEIAGNTNWAKPMMAMSRAAANDVLKLVSTDGNNLSLQMDGNGQYAAFQFDLWLPENMDVMDMALNNERRQGHQLLYNKVGDGHYRVVALSIAANSFNGTSGELLDMTLDGFATDDIRVDDIRFVTPDGSERQFEALGVTRNGFTTSIDEMNSDDNCDKHTIYNLNGQRMNTPQRGLNIINGRKVVIK